MVRLFKDCHLHLSNIPWLSSFFFKFSRLIPEAMTSFKDLRENDFWKKKFLRCLETLDVNKDGFISREDFETIVKRYKELGAPDSHIEKLKTNNEFLYAGWGISDPSVKLTFEEAIEVYTNFLESAKNREKHIEVFALMFEQVDMDGNGWISFDEWENHYKAFVLHLDAAKASFEAMDANKDGKISKEEFVKYHTEYFFTAEDKLKSSILYGPFP